MAVGEEMLPQGKFMSGTLGGKLWQAVEGSPTEFNTETSRSRHGQARPGPSLDITWRGTRPLISTLPSI